MKHAVSRLLIALVAACVVAGCTVQQQMRSNALEYLYPAGAEAVPPTDVVLRLPARVGLAFAPPVNPFSTVGVRGESFSENQKQQLLQRVADAFRGRKNIAVVEVIPSGYLTPKGSFGEMQRLRAGFGVDYMVLVSYDQLQFSESQKSSVLYWVTYGAGAFVIKGEKNETRTLMDAVVYDIDSRRMLFHATGQSAVKGSSTLVDVSKELRQRSEEGFGQAADDLIANLDVALAAFQAQAVNGTVRGQGTPALKLADSRGMVVPVDAAGGGGSIGAGVLLLLAAAGWRRR